MILQPLPSPQPPPPPNRYMKETNQHSHRPLDHVHRPQIPYAFPPSIQLTQTRKFWVSFLQHQQPPGNKHDTLENESGRSGARSCSAG